MLMAKIKYLRLILAGILLVISAGLLIWGLLPTRYESRVLPIPPADMQILTPEAIWRDPCLPS